MTPTRITRWRRGATAVGIALVAAVFLMPVLGIFEFARGDWSGGQT
jgi:Flp pilus assembly protein TadG